MRNRKVYFINNPLEGLKLRKYFYKVYLLFFAFVFFTSCTTENDRLDLSNAIIVVSPSIKSPAKETAKKILVEEISKRTSLQLRTSDNWDNNTVIALALTGEEDLFGVNTPNRSDNDFPEQKKEGYRLVHEKRKGKDILWIIGEDARGVLFGVGQLLRSSKMKDNLIEISKNIDIATAPEYEIRGHQFGYRNTANSWDSWTVEQFEQQFREQVIFGANSFENIPFQDPLSSVHFKISPKEMEIRLSDICNRYDADYWVWTPAPHDLTIKNSHQEGLDVQEAFFAACPRLDAVFVPGGDPGDNHPSALIPYLKDLSVILHKYHPKAGVWVSLQGFNSEKVEYFFDYLKENKPEWLAGIVNGPGSPPIDIERKHLPKKYMLRSYPDITHTVRCQYPVEKWDQAFALTLGREPCNPQPLFYSKTHNKYAPFTNGFLAYSDGIHDDVNKVVWSQLGWDPKKDVRNIIVEYCRFYFGDDVAEESTEGIFALEQNWIGPILGNKTIAETLTLWRKLEGENIHLANNWRWQQLVMRAYYDAYIQNRLIYEKNLETQAYEILAEAESIGADKAINEALIHLQKAEKEFVSPELKSKVFQYAENLFQTIGVQTSMQKYNASGYERGAILDFIDYPLNNRWWLEDEFEKIRTIKTEEEKLKKLEFIRNYEFPGEGSFYDNISSAEASHVISVTDDSIDYLWENNGFSRKRLSTQLFQFTPELQYNELNINANYLIRVSGYGEALLRANGVRLIPTKYEKEFEQFKEFPLPKELIKDGKLKITFDKPDEEHLNWRKHSRVTDVWVLIQ